MKDFRRRHSLDLGCENALCLETYNVTDPQPLWLHQTQKFLTRRSHFVSVGGDLRSASMCSNCYRFIDFVSMMTPVDQSDSQVQYSLVLEAQLRCVLVCLCM